MPPPTTPSDDRIGVRRFAAGRQRCIRSATHGEVGVLGCFALHCHSMFIVLACSVHPIVLPAMTPYDVSPNPGDMSGEGDES